MDDGSDFDRDWDDRFEGLSEDWEVIERVLPDGWQEAARLTGALRRTRGFKDAASLLRVMLIHLVDGCSLRETAVRAQAGGLADVSDVALLGRLRGCGEWFRWMVEQMSRRLSTTTQDVLVGKRVRLVDASVVCEPGATGSTWRIHYMIDLSTLACEQLQVTLPDEGETLTRFEVRANDILMADRGLAHRRGIRHVVAGGGDVIVRSNMVSVPLEDGKGKEVALLPKLRKLKVGEAREWPAFMRDDQGTIALRVCALKKSAEQKRKAQDKLREVASKKQRNLQPDTLEAAGYVVVLTTLREVSAQNILELYRHRWQIELAFKRLKSLLQLGHLKKTDQVGAKAWLQGKLFVATLIETLIAVGERFSPWGYFLSAEQGAPLSLA
ncbi:MAG TPA: IS4 family transposase [Accumulibacter sp.]|uniref:IS4 family transposase n=1 Tax=Accumulibacter sp. TaxID=2053492 RepID=UPI002CA5C849|nr:IS4 family transposase [Accumulibacter sp.]HMW82072.1 IS4 family transposase [Accumulibacter sp.]